MIYLQLVLKESEHKYMSILFFIASLALNEELRKFMIALGFDTGKNTCTLQLAPIHEKKKLFWTKCIYINKSISVWRFRQVYWQFQCTRKRKRGFQPNKANLFPRYYQLVELFLVKLKLPRKDKHVHRSKRANSCMSCHARSESCYHTNLGQIPKHIICYCGAG